MSSVVILNRSQEMSFILPTRVSIGTPNKGPKLKQKTSALNIKTMDLTKNKGILKRAKIGSQNMLTPQNNERLPVIKERQRLDQRSMNRLLSLNEFKLERHLIDKIPSKKDLQVRLGGENHLDIPNL